jgi:hypothetical protein
MIPAITTVAAEMRAFPDFEGSWTIVVLLRLGGERKIDRLTSRERTLHRHGFQVCL